MLIYNCCDSCGDLINEDRRCVRCVRLVGPYQPPPVAKQTLLRRYRLLRSDRKQVA
jgi:hypothetical protein